MFSEKEIPHKNNEVFNILLRNLYLKYQIEQSKGRVSEITSDEELEYIFFTKLKV